MKKILVTILLIALMTAGVFANSKTDKSGFAIEAGYGNGTGGLGMTFEYFTVGNNPNTRSAILIGLGIWPDSLLFEDADPALGFTVGIRNFVGNGNHSFVSELTYGTVLVVTSLDNYGYYESKAFYGPTVGLGYQYMSDGGFIITATAGVSTVIARESIFEIWLPTFTLSSGFKF